MDRTGTTGYLVGGTVRDALLGRPVADVDVAVASGEERLARELSADGLGTAFALSPPGAALPVWRVARGDSIVDVARFERGGTIEDDLARRDFTVNAIAREVGGRRLVDPFGGAADLRAGRIRSISDANLESDPLRVLRAYRLAATRGWTIVPDTRRRLARHARLVRRAAPERLHDELARLLAGKAARAIGWALADGVLGATLGIPPSRAARRAAGRLPPARRGETALETGAGRLAILLRAGGLASSSSTDTLRRLKFSRAEIRETARRRRFLDAAFSGAAADRVLFAHRDALSSLLRLADAAAATRAERSRAAELRRAARRTARADAPVDGNDLRTWLGIGAGPEVGRRLEAARFGWFTRRWRTREEIRRGISALPPD